MAGETLFLAGTRGQGRQNEGQSGADSTLPPAAVPALEEGNRGMSPFNVCVYVVG